MWCSKKLLGAASLLGARTLLGAPGLTTRSKDATKGRKELPETASRVTCPQEFQAFCRSAEHEGLGGTFGMHPQVFSDFYLFANVRGAQLYQRANPALRMGRAEETLNSGMPASK